jgi:hypothetical protein
MKGVHIGCPVHTAYAIGRIEPSPNGPAFVWKFPNEFRRMREEGEPQVPETLEPGSFSLTDTRADRWIEKGWSIDTWCPKCRGSKCRGVYRLPVSWLREVMERDGPWVAAAPSHTAAILSEDI